MSTQAKPLLEFLTRYRWPLFILWVFVFRLPHILGADLRLDGDGAHHWLVMDRIYKGEAFVLHPHGMDHIGLIEFLFATPFVALFGHTQLPYQLGLVFIFLITAWPLFLFARRGYGESAASWVLILMALPHPFVQFISLRPYGGHLLCNALGLLVLYLWWRRVSNPGGVRPAVQLSGARDLLYWAGVGALGGVALYTNRLYAIPLAAHLGVWILHAVTREKSARQFVALALFAVGFAIGGLPQWLGGHFEPFAPNYPNAGFNPGLENLESNAAVFASTLLPNLLDIVYFDGFGEAGFVPPGDFKKAVPIWQGLIVLLAIGPLIRLVPRGIAYLRGQGPLTVGVLATAIVVANTLAILITKLPIWGFSARYLLASILILIPIYAAFAAGLYDAPAAPRDASGRLSFQKAFAFLNRIPFLDRFAALFRSAPRIYAIGHLLLFIAAYAYGYRPSATIYSKPATAGAQEVSAYLKTNGHDRCLANYWIAYNLIYSSGRKILASPTTQYPGLGPVRDPQIERAILEDPVGLRCVIDHRFTMADGRNAAPGKVWTPVKDGPLRMRVSERHTIADWIILFGDPVAGR
ncbi:MAG: hypothetical protein NXI24_23245 [bacterium]|nr:hypothetical protein [bacterium]